MAYRCALHTEEPITHFCQSCKDLACEICIQKQPHSGSIHIVKQITDSVNVRKNLFADYISKQVDPLRSRANKKISGMQLLKKQSERDKKIIDKDIKIEFQAINNRLKDKQTLAILEKQNQIKHVQNYVHVLDDITNAFDTVFENPQAVLISYKTFQNEIKKLQSLRNIITDNQNKNTVDGSANREYLSTYHKSQTLKQYEDRNQFVNKMIEKYAKHYKSELQKAQKDCQKFGKQCNQIYNNTFKKIVSDQVAKCCAFCGCPFTIQNLNQQCNNNRTYKMNCIKADIDWEKVIPADVRGSKRHFWHRSTINQRLRPRMEEHQIIRKVTKKHYFNGLQQLETVKHVLIAYQIQKGKTFDKVVESNDTNKNGYISKIAFIYTLSKIYNIPMQQIQTLIHLLEDQNGIHYANLLKILQNPTQDYFKFVELEQEMQKTKPHGPASMSRTGHGYQNYRPSQSQGQNQNHNHNQYATQGGGGYSQNKGQNYGAQSSGMNQSQNQGFNEGNAQGTSYGTTGQGNNQGYSQGYSTGTSYKPNKGFCGHNHS